MNIEIDLTKTQLGLGFRSYYEGAGGVAIGRIAVRWLEENVGKIGEDWDVLYFTANAIKFKDPDKAVAFKLVFGEYL
jgi:hypothetical protein